MFLRYLRVVRCFKKAKKSIIIFLVMVVACSVFADTEAMPYAHVTSSPDGRFFFKMIPGGPVDKERVSISERSRVIEDSIKGAQGIAYRMLSDGSSEEIWRTNGWYSFRTFLSNNGEYLVRIGPWSRGEGPSKDDLAIAFYRKGKLLKQYSTLELVKDKSKVRQSMSHYQWISYDEDLRVDWNDCFHLQTCDKITYLFDVKTGEIKETKVPSK